MPTSDVSFSSIAIDHVTMPPSSSTKYILNVIDFATRFIAPAAVSSTSAQDVIKHLHQVFYNYGTPDHCLSDHGSAFESTEFKRFMRLHCVELHYSTAYRPEGNGLVERSNGTLLSVLRKICALEPLSWPKILHEAAFAINTSVNSSTSFIPFQLLFGYVHKIPLQLHRPIKQSDFAERILDVATQWSEAAQASQQEIYDRNHRPHNFSVGDLVWVKRQVPIQHGKLSPRFNGVYRLVEQLTPGTFKALRVSSYGSRLLNQPRMVHVSQIKTYNPPVSPVAIPEPNHDTQPADLGDTQASPLPSHSSSEHRPQRSRRRPSHLQDYELY
ncbi:uncharacterized protein LOC135384672 [Ornithodoros turicata]|uniref:uncharacterized protein LOC135384672 n=1 Tax=Ornithodoros turicata TaxID=34597 RepID=UPI003139371E